MHRVYLVNCILVPSISSASDRFLPRNGPASQIGQRLGRGDSSGHSRAQVCGDDSRHGTGRQCLVDVARLQHRPTLARAGSSAVARSDVSGQRQRQRSISVEHQMAVEATRRRSRGGDGGRLAVCRSNTGADHGGETERQFGIPCHRQLARERRLIVHHLRAASHRNSGIGPTARPELHEYLA